jgi:1-acyl-sn-glycerol-3-phosphate acyltransferase
METYSSILLILLVGFTFWQFKRLFDACRNANRVDWGGRWINLLDGLNRIFCYRYHRLNVTGIRLPKEGGAIVVANHVSGLDPFLLIASARRPLRFLIAREQYERFGLTWLFKASGCIPVDREKNPERALRAALRALREGEVLALFPHGKIHLDTDPPRKLKPGAIRLAEMTNSPIFPVRITGISGQGKVVIGVILRSDANINVFPPLYLNQERSEKDKVKLQILLDGKISTI